MECGSLPRAVWLWLGGAALVLLWSGISSHDRTTWWLEVFPVLLGAPLLALTARRFPLTPLLYALLFAHAVILWSAGTTRMRAFRSAQMELVIPSSSYHFTTATRLIISFPSSLRLTQVILNDT